MLNRVTLIGRLGRDPELKDSRDGSKWCRMSLATDDSYTDRDGQRQTVTDWHSVVVNGKQAEACARSLRKGSKCCVEGKIKTHKTTGNDGVERWVTDIRASNVIFLDSKNGDNGGSARQATAAAPRQAAQQAQSFPPEDQSQYESSVPF